MRKLTLGQLRVLFRVVDMALHEHLSDLSPEQRTTLEAAADKLHEGIVNATTHRRNRRERPQTAADVS